MKPRKVYAVPADDPKPVTKKYSIEEIERVLRAFDRDQQPIRDFRKKPTRTK